MEIVAQFIASILNIAPPLIFAALAGMFSERSGIVDIGLEGKMLVAAFASAVVAYWTGSASLAILAGIFTALVFSMMHGVSAITFKGNQVISGLGINILAAGLTSVLIYVFFAQDGLTPIIKSSSQPMFINFPNIEFLSNYPMVNYFYTNVISGQNILTYFAFVAVFLSWFVFKKTRYGLHVIASGENPHVLFSTGQSVIFYRYTALIFTGIFTGLGGTFISIVQNNSFVRDMTAGQGYLALAALIFGKWKPLNVLLVCFLFSFFEVLSFRYSGKVLFGFLVLPPELISVLPYFMTILALSFTTGAVAPTALGKPYSKKG